MLYYRFECTFFEVHDAFRVISVECLPYIVCIGGDSEIYKCGGAVYIIYAFVDQLRVLGVRFVSIII